MQQPCYCGRVKEEFIRFFCFSEKSTLFIMLVHPQWDDEDNTQKVSFCIQIHRILFVFCLTRAVIGPS